MTFYHLNRRVGNEELVKEVEKVLQTMYNDIYDGKIKPLEDEVKRLSSLVERIKANGTIPRKFDENERIKDLTKYALSLVNLDNEKDDLGCCPGCYFEERGEQERTTFRSVMIEGDKIAYGERCKSIECKNKFYKQGEIPLTMSVKNAPKNVW